MAVDPFAHDRIDLLTERLNRALTEIDYLKSCVRALIDGVTAARVYVAPDRGEGDPV